MLRLVFSLLLLLLHFNKSQAISNELRFIHKEIAMLKNENQQQNSQIAHLMEIINESSHQQQDQSALNNTTDAKEWKTTKEAHDGRGKRPVRLLPPRILFGEKRKNTDDKPIRRFFGPPTNCSDLFQLGYTLNGFYTVKSSSINFTISNTNEIDIETIYCSFKQPEGNFNSSLVEKRISSSSKSEEFKLASNKNAINFRSQLHSTIKLGVKRIIFDRTTTNIGKSFNERNGSFEAPKSGIYKFIFKGAFITPQNLVPKWGTLDIGISLVVNDRIEVAKARYYVQDNGVASSKDLLIEETLKLNRGEKVYLRPGGPSEKDVSALKKVELDDDKTFFSGFLFYEFDD